MAVIDEKGRLFGVVNVVDLAVAVVVLATLVAGAAVVLDDPEPPEQRYVTVVLEERPTTVSQTLDGASAQLGGLDGNITDTYRAPTGDDGVRTVLRLRVSVSAAAANRSTDERLATGAGGAYLVGEGVRVTSGEASYTGYLSAVSRNGSKLPVRRVNTTVVARPPPSVADRVERGDVQQVGGKERARVLAVDRRSTIANRTRLRVTLSIRALAVDGAVRYGDQIVRPGANLTFATDDYEFTGTVTRVDRDG